MKIHIGASRLRKTLETLEPEDATALMTRLFPELAHRRIVLLVSNLGETVVSGPHLTMPPSWSTMLGDFEEPPKPVGHRGRPRKEKPNG